MYSGGATNAKNRFITQIFKNAWMDYKTKSGGFIPHLQPKAHD
jgi:hypothetical protein